MSAQLRKLVEPYKPAMVKTFPKAGRQMDFVPIEHAVQRALAEML